MGDDELCRWEPKDGFPAVAAFIARDPDHETYVFRKFKRLTARTLLHLQSELVDLEHRLDELDHEAAKSTDMQLRRSMRNWEAFTAHADSRDSIEGARKRLFDELETTLHKYHEILVLESEVAKLDGPSERVLRAYFNDFKGGKNGDDPKLGGLSETILDDKEDLIALKHPKHRDPLSRFLLNHWLFSTHDRSKGSGGEAVQARYFREKILILIVNVVSTTIAALLLIGSILALYFVREPNSRLGLVIMFIVLFAIGLGLTTNANRDSIFAATAAYAAVLVVFVSGNLGNASYG